MIRPLHIPPEAGCPAPEPFLVPPMPRIVHLMWLPNWQQVPAKLRDTRAAWCHLNPSWEIRFWSQTAVEDLIVSHYPEFLPLWASLADELVVKRADLARFLVLHRHGGLYADMDLMPLRPLLCSNTVTADWLLAYEWTAEGEPARVCNGFLGSCTPASPVIIPLLRNAAAHAHWPVLDFLGPKVCSPVLLTQPALVLPWDRVLSKAPGREALTRNMDSQSWGCPPAPGLPRYSC